MGIVWPVIEPRHLLSSTGTALRKDTNTDKSPIESSTLRLSPMVVAHLDNRDKGDPPSTGSKPSTYEFTLGFARAECEINTTIISLESLVNTGWTNTSAKGSGRNGWRAGYRAYTVPIHPPPFIPPYLSLPVPSPPPIPAALPQLIPLSHLCFYPLLHCLSLSILPSLPAPSLPSVLYIFLPSLLCPPNVPCFCLSLHVLRLLLSPMILFSLSLSASCPRLFHPCISLYLPVLLTLDSLKFTPFSFPPSVYISTVPLHFENSLTLRVPPLYPFLPPCPTGLPAPAFLLPSPSFSSLSHYHSLQYLYLIHASSSQLPP